MLARSLLRAIYLACAPAALAVADATAEPTTITGAHPTPNAFGLVGCEGVLEALLLNGAEGADPLGRHCRSLVLAGREEDVGVRSCTGGVIPPRMLGLPELLVKCHYQSAHPLLGRKYSLQRTLEYMNSNIRRAKADDGLRFCPGQALFT
jgi:hypothetical protein